MMEEKQNNLLELVEGLEDRFYIAQWGVDVCLDDIL